MSFSSDAKKEICQKNNSGLRDSLSETYAFFICFENFAFTTSNRAVAKRLSENLASCVSVIVDIQNSKNIITVSFPDENDRLKTEKLFKNFKIESIESINAFLRGIFLACGTVTDPKIDYHLEFSSENHFPIIIEKLRQIGLSPKITNRKAQKIVYLNGKEQIEDFLGHIGAIDAYWKFFDVSLEKEIRGKANRIANCDNANISKTVRASARQIEAIKKIQNKNGLSTLSPALREIAEIRLENPEMSLGEIADELGISRSGANHRMEKLLRLAED